MLKVADELQEARGRTLELIEDLNDEQMIGPPLSIVNPLRWEIGHVAWFQEYWTLRHLARQKPIMAGGDDLYDSARIAHDTRLDLGLPSKTQTLDYARTVLDRVIDLTTHDPDALTKDAFYFLSLALFHEDMHAEAITYTRQTLSYARPRVNHPQTKLDALSERPFTASSLGDAVVPGGTFFLGSASGQPFVFDNEMMAHNVKVSSFAISRTAVSNREFAEFVGDHGYERPELWTEDGWKWRLTTCAMHPVYWQHEDGTWLCRKFDELVTLADDLPVLHVNWYEADAYCRWAGRRLPTEAEWEMAASAEPDQNDGGISTHKRLFPWGNEPPTPERANLDWRAMGCVEVGALPEGDSAFGCRQMIGNVWEWTATDFAPYPGFVAGPYKEYSAPWFGDHKVLRGGCWATRARLITNTYRNYHKPDRRDVWAGFRTCALTL